MIKFDQQYTTIILSFCNTAIDSEKEKLAESFPPLFNLEETFSIMNPRVFLNKVFLVECEIIIIVNSFWSYRFGQAAFKPTLTVNKSVFWQNNIHFSVLHLQIFEKFVLELPCLELLSPGEALQSTIWDKKDFTIKTNELSSVIIAIFFVLI